MARDGGAVALRRDRPHRRGPVAYVLSFALEFLDAALEIRPDALDLLDHLGRFVPSDGALPVDGETLHLPACAPEPNRPIRALLDPDAVAADHDRLERAQQPDGGWTVGFDTCSEAAALDRRAATPRSTR